MPAGLADLWTEKVASGINDFAPDVCQALTDAGCMWNGVAAVKAGAIVIGILLGTMVAFIIDRRLDKVAIVAFVGAVLSFIGIIHSAAITINFTNQWGIGYLITGVVCLILHFGRNSLVQTGRRYAGVCGRPVGESARDFLTELEFRSIICI